MEKSYCVAVHLEIEEIWIKCIPTLFYSIKGSTLLKRKKCSPEKEKSQVNTQWFGHAKSHLFAFRPKVKILGLWFKLCHILSWMFLNLTESDFPHL